jgi:hypothetical protein
MTHTQSAPKPEEGVERRIARLKVLNKLSQFALPVAAASAGVAAIAFTPVFPIAAAIAAVAVAASEVFIRHERKELDADIKELGEQGGVGSARLAELSSEANRLTVSGPSN